MEKTIQIDCVRIAGFRGIQNIEMTLSRITVLIGPNNSGKTSILKALQLALGNYSQYISEEDFFITKEDNRTQEIIVDVRLVSVNNGKRISNFDDKWISHFSDKIQKDENGYDFVAIRTTLKSDEIKGGFECSRYIMQRWPHFNTWQNEKMREKDKMRHRMTQNVLFISVEAQRDIYHELRDKASFAGRILSDIKYSKTDMDKIEQQIQEINQEAVKKSQILDNFKDHLKELSQSFQGKGDVEISPFPKKIRDLTKHFSIHFGEKDTGIFSMEYHGMGTRSWASMLTVKAFIELLADKYEKESEAFLPIFATEEPEAHLHPNAQKTLYHQIAKSRGQVIVSTHSPYFIAPANISDIRSLIKTDAGISIKNPSKNFNLAEIKKINRKVISIRGDILFARAWILCEGITEEQIIPAMFEILEKKSLSNFGICCVGINGKHYSVFLKLAHNMGIPAYIISDNDSSTKQEVTAQIEAFKIQTKEAFNDIFFLTDGNNFEKELLNTLSLKEEIIETLVYLETDGSNNENYVKEKKKEISKLNLEQILNKMEKSKAAYSGFLSDIIRENPRKKIRKKLFQKLF